MIKIGVGQIILGAMLVVVGGLRLREVGDFAAMVAMAAGFYFLWCGIDDDDDHLLRT